jgi:hypothetical protein
MTGPAWLEGRLLSAYPPIGRRVRVERLKGIFIGWWDHDHELAAVVSQSRLIHPTFVGFAYAARLGFEGSDLKQIFPAEIIGISREAFLSPSPVRDWLTETEAQQLRDLVAALKQQLPKRVHNALWHHEYAARTYYLGSSMDFSLYGTGSDGAYRPRP